MPKKAMELLTETMFYVLMALSCAPMCGTDIVSWAERVTHGRVRMGPATIYTILARFEQEKIIRETEVEGRKRTYCITEKGKKAFEEELFRLRRCVADAEAVRGEKHEK